MTPSPDTLPAPRVPGTEATEFSLGPTAASGLLRMLEAAPAVRRRYHFFVWLRSHVHVLLPHHLAVCGAYQRQRRELVFEVFQCVVLPDDAVAALSGVAPPALARLTDLWLARQGGLLALDLAQPAPAGLQPLWAQLTTAGLGHLLVHGISRPQRPQELESLFVLAGAGARPGPDSEFHFELLLPVLHATYLRMRETERALGLSPERSLPLPAPAGVQQLTTREREILLWVRDGMSNQQIAARLGISALTVKNHIQKILRKCGAANRTQAVAMALSAKVIGRHDGVEGEAG